MRKRVLLIAPLALLTLIGCNDNQRNKDVVLSRYIHKRGYDVSKQEWEAEKYPGQVLTTYKDGKTIVETFDDGTLHGPRTETYPHSQTIHFEEAYNRGKLVKRMHFNIRGVPEKEEFFKSPTNIVVTTWYPTGSPKSKEEFHDHMLVSGQYFNTFNETDSRIENGVGERTNRNPSGDLLSKEIFNNFVITYVETYYPNNRPHTSTSYESGEMHGERKVFEMTGEPILVETYFHGKRHGQCVYYQNGFKYLEIPFHNGIKEGVEKHYIDGEILSEETEYHGGLKHGPSIVYADGSLKTSWYFENQKVDLDKFEKLVKRQEFIMTMRH